MDGTTSKGRGSLAFGAPVNVSIAAVCSSTETSSRKTVVLRVALGQRFVHHLGIKAQHRHARVVYRRRKRRAQNLQLVEPHQLLTRPLGKPGTRQRHRLQRPAKALAALKRRFGHAPQPAIIPRKKAHDQVGLMHRPSAQNHRF